MKKARGKRKTRTFGTSSIQAHRHAEGLAEGVDVSSHRGTPREACASDGTAGTAK